MHSLQSSVQSYHPSEILIWTNSDSFQKGTTSNLWLEFGQALVTTANVRHILNSFGSSWTITVCVVPQQLFCVMWTCATCTRAPFLWSHTEWHKPNALIQTDTQFPFFFICTRKANQTRFRTVFFNYTMSNDFGIVIFQELTGTTTNEKMFKPLGLLNRGNK